MATKVGSPEFLRERADRTRALAATMKDREARQNMLGIAEECERQAEQAAAVETRAFWVRALQWQAI